MRGARSFALAFILALAPASAWGQADVYVVHNGIEYLGYEAAFGTPFRGEPIGPDTLVHVAGTGETAPPLEGCDPLANADELEGNVAMVLRGSCSFVQKVQNAAAAGAIAVIVYNDDRDGPGSETLVTMGGDCEPADGCTIPAVFISRATGLAILAELDDPKIVTLFRSCGDPILFGTGAVATFIFSDGFIGDYPGSDGCFWNFLFNGDEGLNIASVLIGQVEESDTTVTGSPYVIESEYERGYLDFLFPPFDPPFEDFDQALTVSFYDSLGIEVMETAYAREGDAFIVFDLNITNTTNDDLDGIYVGLFADWDVGNAQQNLGGFDASTDLMYVYDESGTSSNYFGVAALGDGGVSGWTLATDEAASDPSLFEGLTTSGEALTEPQDARTVIGVGPFDLAPGDTVNARFALLGGTSEADIIASAAAAQAVVTVAAEESAPEGTFALASAYPNPFAARTTLSFTLPTAQDVRLAVYDVLGREVAVLVDGTRPAGEQAVTFDASELPSGMYVVRLEAGTARLTQRVTVVR